MTLNNIDQFTEQNIDRLHTYLKNKKNVTPTVSLCTECHMHVPAYKYEHDNKVLMIKSCVTHGLMHAIVEVDAEFYYKLDYKHDNEFNSTGVVLVEVTDRCQLDCPHCYHLPENSSTDKPRSELISTFRKHIPFGPNHADAILLAGAEASLRSDFAELCSDIKSEYNNIGIGLLTNGVRLNDNDWLRNAINHGLDSVSVGLNHPSYHNHIIIRQKQERGINNAIDAGCRLGIIAYTTVDLRELDYILNEIINSSWNPSTFRIRVGAEIGRNSTLEPVKVSTMYHAVKAWCDKNDKSFEYINESDNNIYHVNVLIEGKRVRLIHWCDETNIDMENLRHGLSAFFVQQDGLTNFLHQIIRRDTAVNKGIPLLDSPPDRYKFTSLEVDRSELDFFKLYPGVNNND